MPVMNKKILFLLFIVLQIGIFLGSTYQTRKAAQIADSLSASPAMQAWDLFMLRMQSLGQRLLADDLATHFSGGGFPMGTDRDRSDAVRQMAHMLVEGLSIQFDHSDPEFPSLKVVNTDTTGWGGPNVDNKYLRASIRGDATYRLSGNLQGVRDIALQSSKGDLHLGQVGASKTLDKAALSLDAQGDFSITISAQPQTEGDWLPLAADHTLLSIRVYFADWTQDRDGRFYLAKVGNEGRSPEILTEALVAQRLTKAAEWIEGSLIGWQRWMQAATWRDKVNTVSPPRSVDGGSSNMAYGSLPFDLAPDEAMIIELLPPPADYWSFQTYTHAWFDAGDYANRLTSLNMTQAYHSPDGKVWFVLAHRDPAVPNWIDTESRQRALLTHRWMKAEQAPQLRAQRVPFAELRAHLPADMPTLSAEQRRQQIAVRQRHIQHRFHN